MEVERDVVKARRRSCSDDGPGSERNDRGRREIVLDLTEHPTVEGWTGQGIDLDELPVDRALVVKN